VVCIYGNQWRFRHSYLGTGYMEVFDSELLVTGLALDVTNEKRETLQRHGVKTVTVFSDLQTAIPDVGHLDLGPWP